MVTKFHVKGKSKCIDRNNSKIRIAIGVFERAATDRTTFRTVAAELHAEWTPKFDCDNGVLFAINASPPMIEIINGSDISLSFSTHLKWLIDSTFQSEVDYTGNIYQATMVTLQMASSIVTNELEKPRRVNQFVVLASIWGVTFLIYLWIIYGSFLNKS